MDDKITMVMALLGGAVAILVGVLNISKVAMDIATTPTHRSIALKALIIGRNCVPFTLVIVAWSLPARSIWWAAGLILFAVILYCLIYLLSEAAPTRLDTVSLILFVAMSFSAIEGLTLSYFIDGLNKALATPAVKALDQANGTGASAGGTQP